MFCQWTTEQTGTVHWELQDRHNWADINRIYMKCWIQCATCPNCFGTAEITLYLTSLFLIFRSFTCHYALPSYFSIIHFNTTLPLMPTSFNRHFSLTSLHQNMEHVLTLMYMCHMPCPSHPPWSDHPNSIWWEMQILQLLTMTFSILQNLPSL